MPEPEWCWELRMIAWFLMTAGPALFAVTVISSRWAESIAVG